jgi:hypothetical protein
MNRTAQRDLEEIQRRAVAELIKVAGGAKAPDHAFRIGSMDHLSAGLFSQTA